MHNALVPGGVFVFDVSTPGRAGPDRVRERFRDRDEALERAGFDVEFRNSYGDQRSASVPAEGWIVVVARPRPLPPRRRYTDRRAYHPRVRKLAGLVVVVSIVSALALASCSSSKSRAKPAATTTTTRPVVGPLTLTGEQPVSFLYSQGVARVPDGWIFSFRFGLYRTDDALHEVQSVSPAIPPEWSARGFNHIGDIDVVGNYIYAPFEQSDYEKNQQATARYDVKTLRFVDAVSLAQHENSFVAIDPATMTAYSMDRFDGDTLLRYDVAHNWKPLPPLQMSMLLHRTQGGAVAHGAIWISTDDDHKAIYRVDLATGHVDDVGKMGHPGGEGEGIAAADLPSGQLHTVCVDAALNPVWFAHFRAA